MRNDDWGARRTFLKAAFGLTTTAGVSAVAAGSASGDPSYRQIAAAPEQIFAGRITRELGAYKTADVVWPDGTPGRFRTLELNRACTGAIDSYEVTYGEPAIRTYVQPCVVRDETSGEVVERPAIVVK